MRKVRGEGRKAIRVKNGHRVRSRPVLCYSTAHDPTSCDPLMAARDDARDMVTLKVTEARIAATALRGYKNPDPDDLLNVVVLTDLEAQALLPGVFPDAIKNDGWEDALHSAVGKVMETQTK